MRKSKKIVLSVVGILVLAGFAGAILVNTLNTNKSSEEDTATTREEDGVFINEGSLGEVLLGDNPSDEEVARLRTIEAEQLSAAGDYDGALAKIAEVQDGLSGEQLINAYRVQIGVYLAQDQLDKAIEATKKVLEIDDISSNPEYKASWEKALAQYENGQNPYKEERAQDEAETR